MFLKYLKIIYYRDNNNKSIDTFLILVVIQTAGVRLDATDLGTMIGIIILRLCITEYPPIKFSHTRAAVKCSPSDRKLDFKENIGEYRTKTPVFLVSSKFNVFHAADINKFHLNRRVSKHRRLFSGYSMKCT